MRSKCHSTDLVPLRGKKKICSDHAHKTEFWYLLGVFCNISNDHPRHFYMGVWEFPPPPPPFTKAIHQVPVVQRADNCVHWIVTYPLGNIIHSLNNQGRTSKILTVSNALFTPRLKHVLKLFS